MSWRSRTQVCRSSHWRRNPKSQARKGRARRDSFRDSARLLLANDSEYGIIRDQAGANKDVLNLESDFGV